MTVSTRRERLKAKIDLHLYAWILAFYGILAAAISLITYLVNLYQIRPDAYNLNASLPQTIIFATFINGTWDHLTSNLQSLVLLFRGVAIAPLAEPSFMRNKRFLRLVCLGTLLSGLASATVYYFVLVGLRIGPDGAGTSIINAGLIGILILLFIRISWSNLSRRQWDCLLISLLFEFMLIGVLVTGFLQAGNVVAHLFGFLVGFVGALWYT